jgi:ABC-type nickel/cobalt efflux system permease component RcnA
VAAQSLVLAPILVSAVAPARSTKLLDAMQDWLERNSRVIVTAVLLIFGVWLLWKGIAGLIG